MDFKGQKLKPKLTGEICSVYAIAASEATGEVAEHSKQAKPRGK